MCGICGIFVLDGESPVNEASIRRMTATLRHRGPDDEGLYVAPGVGLGHRRLSIIDVAGGHQPISNEDGTIWVLLNGEIYNYSELRAELLRRNHRFSTFSDTESIVHLYEDLGEECFARLRGMFAIAIWDARQRRLLLARDRVGKKPLFYGTAGERFVFGSELKALLTAGDFSHDVDGQALSDYFSLGYVPAPKSIYRAARKVRPAHYLVVSRSGTRESCYWKLSFRADTDCPKEEWCERILASLEEATRIRLMSEVPLGAFLSGGVDSSAVVAMMSRAGTEQITTCSIGFAEDEFSEAEFARRLAVQFHTRHFERTVRPEAMDILEKLAWHFDEPFADSSAVPTYYVCQAAKETVTVALGGDGGDESFAGYDRYYLDVLENRLRGWLPRVVRASIFGPLGQVYPHLPNAARIFRAKYRFQSLAQDPLSGYFNSISIFRPDEKSQLLSPDFRASLGDYDSISVLAEHYRSADTDDPLSRIQYVDIKTYLPDDILVKVDRASMAVALEVRAPLLDHKFMEVAASIPSSMKLVGNTGKYIFKKALESILPHETLHRPKHGFGVPIRDWFRSELRDFAYEALFRNDDDFLNRRYLLKIWQEHQAHHVDRSSCLWAALMYFRWKELFRRELNTAEECWNHAFISGRFSGLPAPRLSANELLRLRLAR
jgi:asparagine synthase (glutamine-hydrolysing)